LKTALISELGALTPSSLRWKESATPAGRSWFVLQTSAQITKDPDHGSSDATSGRLPTPTKTRYGSQSYPEDPSKKRPSLDTLLHTPPAKANMHNPSMEKWPSCQGWGLIANPEKLPTPTKRDKRMDAWSPAYDKRKSPTMDAVMDGALTGRASGKWKYARMIASILTDHGLYGASMTLPVVYGWMMGYPAGWLERALLSAVREGLLPLPSSSKRTATRSSRRSRKPSEGRS